jgi:serine/threonine protein kinase
MLFPNALFYLALATRFWYVILIYCFPSLFNKEFGNYNNPSMNRFCLIKVKMYTTFKDAYYLYIVLEFVPGGEFFTFLRKSRRFENSAACFYAAQITLIFEYLHSKNIVYRYVFQSIFLRKEKKFFFFL